MRQTHAIESAHVEYDPVPSQRLAAHAVPRSGDRYRQTLRPRCRESVADHANRVIGIGGNLDDARNGCRIQPAGVVEDPARGRDPDRGCGVTECDADEVVRGASEERARDEEAAEEEAADESEERRAIHASPTW